jgi:hypothetical protein
MTTPRGTSSGRLRGIPQGGATLLRTMRQAWPDPYCRIAVGSVSFRYSLSANFPLQFYVSVADCTAGCLRLNSKT